jgi:hypothetical protein
MKALLLKRLTALMLLGTVAGCAGPAPMAQAPVAPVSPHAPVCRTARNGGPLLADRGIGGTGSPMVAALTASPVAVNDRAGHVMGIAGIVTGFASICVDGLEVRYDASSVVDIDGAALSAESLRAGQVAIIFAAVAADGLHARSISIRSEVTGRIESVNRGTGVFRIAGQTVWVPAGLGGEGRQAGEWVRVSGLRRPDGVIAASRLDQAPAGTLLVHGRTERAGTVVRVGRLVLPGAVAAGITAGQFVTVTGDYKHGASHVRGVAPDLLAANALTFFGTSMERMSVQAFVRVENGSVRLGDLAVPAAPGLRETSGAARAAVVSLERGPEGGLIAVGLRYVDDQARQASRRHMNAANALR